MMKVKYLAVRFRVTLENGFSMSKEWNNIEEAIKDLQKLKKEIVLVKKDVVK